MLTRQRILFVDDEPLVLEGLGRSLRHLHERWDIRFAESGRQALELMQEARFDVVVADMRMPGMTGVDLLNEVLRRSPDTIRIVLSGHSDRDLLLRSLSTSHRFLAKPCDSHDLQAALQAASLSEDSPSSERVRHLVARIQHLPTVPSVYTRMIDLMSRSEVGLEELGALVAEDPAITAGLLKVVNSAYFGLRRNISDPGDAVHYLGLDVVKSLVLAVGAFAQFHDAGVEGFSLADVWQHSLATATIARRIAQCEEAVPAVRDACFTAGLLHDAGKLVLAEHFTSECAAVVALAREKGLPCHAAEQEVFGADHAQAGGSLFGLWGLPAEVVDAITFHHQPAAGNAPGFSATLAVHAADVLAHRSARENHPGPDFPAIDRPALQRAGMASRWETWQDLVSQA